MKTTVADLLERLKVAEPCAQVVLECGEDRATEFDIRCINPISELAIIFQAESPSAAHRQELRDAERAAEEAEDELSDLKRDSLEIVEKIILTVKNSPEDHKADEVLSEILGLAEELERELF